MFKEIDINNIEFDVDKEAEYVSIMIWDDFTTLKPLTKKKSLAVEK